MTLLELDLAGRAVPDNEVLFLSTSLEQCLITLNRKDFIKLHSIQPNHAGILICTFDADFLALADRIHICLLAVDESIEGQLLRVQKPTS